MRRFRTGPHKIGGATQFLCAAPSPPNPLSAIGGLFSGLLMGDRTHSTCRRLTHPISRRLTRRITSGRAPVGRDFSDAMVAFARVIRARRRLIELAPELFDESVIRQRAEKRDADAKRFAGIAAAIDIVYGGEPGTSFAKMMLKRDEDAAPPERTARTERAIERWEAEQALWLTLAAEAFARVTARPHFWLSLSQIARLLELASQFGRGATGLLFSGDRRKPKPEPESTPSISFEEALEKIYGSTAGT